MKKIQMNNKTRSLLSLIINILIIVLTTLCEIQFFIGVGDGNMQVSGFVSFRYFTILSNVFAALSCIAVIPFNVRILLGKDENYLKAVMLFKFMGTVAVTVTFAVVLAFLGPTMGYASMFVGVNLYLHMLGPILAIISFCFLEKSGKVEKKDFFLGDLALLIYGIVYVINVVWLGVWPDFYGFNAGGLWFVSFPIVVLSGLLLSFILGKVHNKFCK